MSDTVLLTGATGLVGRAVLAALLRQGLQVRAVSRRPPPARRGIIWHQADLLQDTDQARLITTSKAKWLIHCAWVTDHKDFWESAENGSWQRASETLVQRFLDAGGQRVLVTGSCAEYDPAAPGPWNEDRPIAPTTAYGAAKAALHERLAALCGNRLIWARLFHLYGPGEDPRRLIPSLITAFRQGRPAKIRQAGAIRDYASTRHVTDCLAALLMAEPAVHGAFDIGAGHPQSLGDLGKILAHLADRPDLLQLGDEAGQPPIMAPELTRLHGVIGPRIESPEVGLAGLWTQSG